MTVEALPWAIQGQSHNATVARNGIAAMMGAPSAALAAAAQITTAGGSHGVVLSGDLAVTQNGTPNMSVNVAAGRCFVLSQETLSLGDGTYSGFNDATVNVAVAASDPTNPRRDLVIFQVRDSNRSGAFTDARITVVTGTPAASPVDPAVPVNSLVLARIAVAAASTTVVNANITDLRTRAYALGGIAPCTSTTRPSGVSLTDGLAIYETDTQESLVYYSSPAQWRRPWRMPWGIVGRARLSGSNQTGITSVVDVTGSSVTFTAVANRRYRISSRLLVAQQTTAASVSVFLNRAGSDINYMNWVDLAIGGTSMLTGVEEDSPSAGSQTYKLRIATGGGTCSVQNATSAGFVMVEDIGPNGAPA